MQVLPSFEDLLRRMQEYDASDMLLTARMPPVMRIEGHLRALNEYPELTPEASRALVYAILGPEQIERFDTHLELDLSLGVDGVGQFRINVYRQRGAVSAAVRRLPPEIPALDSLGLPEAMKDIVRRNKGLVLVTGPTGHGKSSTLAALIDYLNGLAKHHIITLEDPIEYVHTNRQCVIDQREIGKDTHSFQSALRHVFRQDPDIVLIGEMRDRETMETALTMAETGHLTFSTLHTNSAAESLDRIIDSFPGNQQDQIRAQLSMVLEGILSQRLLPRAGGGRRVLATELLIPSDGIRNLIRRGEIAQLYSQMLLERGRGGHIMNDSLLRLVKAGEITAEVALMASPRPDDMSRKLRAPVT